jgi:iron-sulfur cluster repair protein YtfE (RIC family)
MPDTDPDVFRLLNEDHRLVERLFSQFEQSQDPAVAQEICDELTVHAMVEEELVYPILAVKVGTGYANEARQEHDEAKGVILQIEQGLRGGQDVSALVAQLKEAVQHHVQEEESELWPKMQETLPSVVGELGDEVVDRKKQLQEQIREARELDAPTSSLVGNKATNTQPK